MSRATQTGKNKLIAAVIIVFFIAVGAAADIAAHYQTTKSVSNTTQAPTTQLTYRGQNGQTALALLKMHAKVTTKTSASLGEYVISINGNDGGGKKYWIFYVNGKEAQVGAGAYETHNGDVIQWKLQ